jgi:hypothetical protein
LFFNNIEGFVSGAFPVLRSLYGDRDWQQLLQEFMAQHHCQTPYFLEISQEFLTYLQQRPLAEYDRPFMLELAHYEWVELALEVSEVSLESVVADPSGDLLACLPVVSPLLWSLCYQYPVHRIGPDFQPQLPSEQPSYLLVYRDRDDRVQFMEGNAVTARLLELLQQPDAGSGRQVLLQLAEELRHPRPEQLLASGLDTLQQLQARDIVLGSGKRESGTP